MPTWKNAASITITVGLDEDRGIWTDEANRPLPAAVSRELTARKLQVCDLVIEFTSSGSSDAGSWMQPPDRQEERKVWRVTVDGVGLSKDAAEWVAHFFEGKIEEAEVSEEDGERWDGLGRWGMRGGSTVTKGR